MQKIKDNTCPYCKSTKFKDIIPANKNSELLCLGCAAIFNSPNLPDKDLAGTFTGRYGQVQKENLTKLGFSKDKKKDNDGSN